MASAHGFEPGVLELQEETGGLVRVHWQPPTAGGEVPVGMPETGIALELPSNCRTIMARPGDSTHVDPGGPTANVPVRHTGFWALRCVGGLVRGRVAIPALVTLGDDVFVRIVHADGTVETHVLGPREPSWTWGLAGASGGGTSRWRAARRFFELGGRHIAGGWDHLLFLLGLTLVARRAKPIAIAVTAFTIGHGLALVSSALGLIRVPQPPVEAVIALSIAVMASEIIRDDPTSWIRTRPWLAAGAFGLLHGLGFAAALRELQVPPGARVVALAAFNLGVEAGQLAFVGAWLLFAWLARGLLSDRRETVRRTCAYAIGTVGAWACIDRFVTG